MNDDKTKELMDYITKLVDKQIDQRLDSVAFIKSAIITNISSDNTKVSVQILGESDELTDIENYDVRQISIGDHCQLIYWGDGGKRMNNIALLFGGNSF